MLAYQADLNGILDFRKARLLDRKWFTEVRWACAEMARRKHTEFVRLEHELHRDALTYTAGNEVFKKHWDQLIAAHDKIRDQTYPWMVFDKLNLQSAKTMVSEWEQVFGDRDETMEMRINRTVQNLQKMRQNNKPPQFLADLLAEDNRRRNKPRMRKG